MNIGMMNICTMNIRRLNIQYTKNTSEFTSEMVTDLSLAKSDVFRTRETPPLLANQIAVSKFSSDASATPTKKDGKIMHIFPIF